MSFKVTSILKGENPKEMNCIIYREPTVEEKESDGMATRQILLTEVGALRSNLARMKSGQRLLVYLSSKEGSFSPITGDLTSGRSLLLINPTY